MDLDLDFRLRMIEKRLDDIDRIIMVVSGKGGVGKSVVAATLANHISNEKMVGLLDLDLHGPTLPLLLNHGGRLYGQRDGVNPIMAGRVKFVSLGLLTADKPMPLRGEYKRDLIIELLSQIKWGRLNYLIADLPPGTGDEALTTIRLTIRKASAILVSTPSPHSLEAVRRMFGLLVDEGVKIVGLVLNMAYMVGSHQVVAPFGNYDVKEIEEKIGVGVIAELPLEPEMASSTPINMDKLSGEFYNALIKIYQAIQNK